MKKCFFKVYKNLTIYKKSEFKLIAFKLCFLQNKKNIKIKLFKKKSYQKSFCFETGVKRSVYNYFNLARWDLKSSLSSSKINGLKKISW